MSVASQRRLIPAHAGKTLRAYLVVGGRAAHPRSRGENPPPIDSKALDTGSSPLTRGKPTDEICCCVGHGLIPAHAGKTRYRVRSRHRLGAHPRSRGENESRHSDNPEAVGSSPLTRGKRGGQAIIDPPPRLIPAHAGKTISPLFARGSLPAHPRSRGENASLDAHSSEPTGSSPLTRGKPVTKARAVEFSGLIPAHAGKTDLSAQRAALDEAHPRSRGENDLVDMYYSGQPGSSPLTRGKRYRGCSRPRSRRLIPAHAGKTRVSGRTSAHTSAHPRSRGENGFSPTPHPAHAGSSPLTRGKRELPGRRCVLPGLIPAHAGKT